MTEVIVSIKIRYLNGDEQQFQFIPEVGPGEQANLGTRIHKMFSADPIVIELADRVMMIPLHSVQNIEISPVPAKLPDGSILNARQIS